MVASLPMVATRCGGYEGLITDEENGLLVDVGNPDAIAKTIERVATDIELQDKLGRNAKSHAIEAFDIQVMFKAYQQQYENVMDN